MTTKDYNQTCFAVSELVMRRYSTSFSWGTKMFPHEVRQAIFAIYAFVRFADEIVDSFHDYDKSALLGGLRSDLDLALARGVSTNPILQAFVLTVKKYDIDRRYIQAFFKSMEMDLTVKNFSRRQYEEYIYGSAEVIGLMCLKVFCHGEHVNFDELAEPARKLGSAFQKVNFLRDIKSDLEVRGRIYLPDIPERSKIGIRAKRQIESEIKEEFAQAKEAVRRLPRTVKFAVYSTFLYYQALFFKLQNCDILTLLSRRVRIPNGQKAFLFLRAWLEILFNRI